MSELTDEEAIALATLLGCEFYNIADGEIWFVNDNQSIHHPLEEVRRRAWAHDDSDRRHHWGWESKAALAHAYIDWCRGKITDDDTILP